MKNRIVPESESVEFISKTRKKKEAVSRQELGSRLSGLPKSRIESLGLPEPLVEALLAAGTMKSHGARRRHFQYIGTLMREVDTTAIEALLALDAGEKERHRRLIREVERWRDALLSGGAETFESLAARYPDLDRQRAAQLVRNAQKEASRNTPPKSGRALFRYLKELAEKPHAIAPQHPAILEGTTPDDQNAPN